MKGFLSKKRQSKLTAWVVGGLLCASASSAANLVAVEAASPDFTAPLLGTTDDQAYIDAGVRQADGTYLFTKDSWIAWRNARGENPGAIRLLADLKIDAGDHVLKVTSGAKAADVKEAAGIVNDDGKNVEIKAKALKLTVNDTTSAAPLERAWGIRSAGGTVEISGPIEIDVNLSGAAERLCVVS